jgi:SAM-dependent methyltransferase
MQTELIQRHYDEVIAAHYDLDPQSVIGDSLNRAVTQIRRYLGPADEPHTVLDIGLGTGRFLEKLNAEAGFPVQPFGLDLSARMIDLARARVPGLVAAVDDAANLDAHFQPRSFDLISTHFVTGFVPIGVLAPKIYRRLTDGGYWSLVGGTKAGFPVLRRTAGSRPIRWLFGGRSLDVDGLVSNPADRDEVVEVLEANGFAIRACETFTPELHFASLQEFLEFAYWGGWLTPFIEVLGLHKARPMVRAILNTCVFPVADHHCIEIVLAQKVGGGVRS